jgi:eukaryotic-like serine/threonine-protein kinase
MTNPQSSSVGDPRYLPGYEFKSKLGSGATGTVFLAVQQSTARQVAVKALSPNLLTRPGFRERFRSEARLMTKFDNANLVNIFDYVERDESAFLVMQYVRGAQLRQVVRAGQKLTAEQSLGVLSGALSGLAAAHELGVVHGDLKPENILVTEEGESKLIDFGQSSPAGSRPSGGTPAYASPEAIRDETVDARSDVYAAGLILYELLSGAPPFTGSAGEVASQHRDVTPKRLKGVPSPVAELVSRSLSKDPNERPSSAEDFLRELTEVATQEYGPDWTKRASIAAIAGVAIGGIAGLESAGAATAGGVSTAGHVAVRKSRTLNRVRRLATRVRHAATAHPISAVATVAVVGAAAITVSLLGSSPAAYAGSFSAVSTTSAPTQVSCQSASHCLIDLGSSMLVIGPGGSRSVSQVPFASNSNSSVACASNSYCVAIGANQSGTEIALTSENGGLDWSSSSLPSGTQAVTDISCVTAATQCWAATRGGLLRDNGGGQWSLVSTPTGSGPMSLISCPALNTCVGAAGGTAESTHDGGSTWTSVALQGIDYGPSDLDCVTAEVCWVVGEYSNSLQSQIGSVNRTTDGGRSWNQVAFPANPHPYAFDSISCWDPASCLVDGTAVWEGLEEGSSGRPYFLSTTDAGASWRVHLAPETMPFPPSIHCFNSGDCWLSGQSGTGVTTDGGSSWNVSFYGSKLLLSSVSCVTPDECFVAGSFPDLVMTHLGTQINPMGVLFRLSQTDGYSGIDASDSAYGSFTDLSCPSSLSCVAVGINSSNVPTSLLELNASGTGSPRSTALPKDVQSVEGAACPGTSDCLLTVEVGGQPSLLHRSGGGGWASIALPFGTQSVGPIACSDVSQCLVIASGSSGPALLDVTFQASGGIRWRSIAVPADVHSLTSIDCPTAIACWLAATTGSNGTQAQVLRTLDLKAQQGQLSVTSTTASSSSTSTTKPALSTHWAAQAIPVGVTSITSISCPSTAACFAIATLSNGSQALLSAGGAGTPLRGEIAPPPTS